MNEIFIDKAGLSYRNNLKFIHMNVGRIVNAPAFLGARGFEENNNLNRQEAQLESSCDCNLQACICN